MTRKSAALALKEPRLMPRPATRAVRPVAGLLLSVPVDVCWTLAWLSSACASVTRCHLLRPTPTYRSLLCCVHSRCATAVLIGPQHCLSARLISFVASVQPLVAALDFESRHVVRRPFFAWRALCLCVSLCV
jgi:hypothetical protein